MTGERLALAALDAISAEYRAHGRTRLGMRAGVVKRLPSAETLPCKMEEPLPPKAPALQSCTSSTSVRYLEFPALPERVRFCGGLA